MIEPRSGDLRPDDTCAQWVRSPSPQARAAPSGLPEPSRRLVIGEHSRTVNFRGPWALCR